MLNVRIPRSSLRNAVGSPVCRNWVVCPQFTCEPWYASIDLSKSFTCSTPGLLMPELFASDRIDDGIT